LIVPGDDAVVEAVRAELAEGNEYLRRDRYGDGSVTVYPADGLGVVSVVLSGRFRDRHLELVVEIDPARVGWQLEATLIETPAGDNVASFTETIGRSRSASLEDGIQAARVLSTAGWVALRRRADRNSRAETSDEPTQ
jgi:hypothetical protein